MTLRTLLTLLPLATTLALGGCGDDDEKDDDEEDEQGTDLPAEGTWTASDAVVVSDGCGMGDPGDDTGDAGDDTTTIVVTGEDSFTITGEDMQLTCTRDGTGFDCGAQTETTDLNSEGLDAILEQTLGYRVTLDTPTAGTVEVGFSMQCEGTGCDALSEAAEIPLPCESLIRMDIAHDG